MKAFVYILFSPKYKKSYTGSTINLEKRLIEHNKGQSFFTKAYMPWSLIYFEEFDSLSKARLREKYFKSHAGRKVLKKMFQEKNIFR